MRLFQGMGKVLQGGLCAVSAASQEDPGTDTTQFKRAIDMTDDELAAIASGAKLTVVKWQIVRQALITQ